MNQFVNIEVFPYVGLVGYEDDKGVVTPVLEHALLVGDNGKPSYETEITFDELFMQFVDMNTINGTHMTRATKEQMFNVLNEIRLLTQDFMQIIEDVPEEEPNHPQELGLPEFEDQRPLSLDERLQEELEQEAIQFVETPKPPKVAKKTAAKGARKTVKKTDK